MNSGSGRILIINYPVGNYMFKVNNRNTRTSCEICSKLIMKTPYSSVSIVNFEQINVEGSLPKCRFSDDFRGNKVVFFVHGFYFYIIGCFFDENILNIFFLVLYIWFMVISFKCQYCNLCLPSKVFGRNAKYKDIIFSKILNVLFIRKIREPVLMYIHLLSISQCVKVYICVSVAMLPLYVALSVYGGLYVYIFLSIYMCVCV